jgi:putative ABC transport system ATP-binding protein
MVEGQMVAVIICGQVRTENYVVDRDLAVHHARAIVTDPTILLCDEPTGDLDRKSGDEILSLLQALNREQGKTIIMVTHDPHASARATRTVYLDKGQLSTTKPE